MPKPELLYGWEPRTFYVPAPDATRGQAKALVAWEEGEAFTDMRSRQVWLEYREVTEDEAAETWIEAWYPGYHGWLGCDRATPGAVAYWEVTLPRPVASSSVSENKDRQR